MLRLVGCRPAGVKLADVQARLVEDLRERKSREQSGQVFRGLQDVAKVENVLNDPQQSAASPGVAARVNGQPIPLDVVREKCVDRYGREVLEIMITRLLLGQALTRAQRTVAQADIDRIDEADRGPAARIHAAANDVDLDQIGARQMQALQYRLFQFALAVIEGKFQLCQAQHAR